MAIYVLRTCRVESTSLKPFSGPPGQTDRHTEDRRPRRPPPSRRKFSSRGEAARPPTPIFTTFTTFPLGNPPLFEWNIGVKGGTNVAPELSRVGSAIKREGFAVGAADAAAARGPGGGAIVPCHGMTRPGPEAR